jgi:hypothetical protein
VENNILDGAWGNLFANGTVNSAGAERSPDGNVIRNNILSRAKAWNFYQAKDNGATPSGNAFHNNCLYGTRKGKYFNGPTNVQPKITGWAQSGTVIANPDAPGYVDASNGNFQLRQGSPCIGKGPSYIQP